MCGNSIIHSSTIILVTMEESPFIYHLIDVNRPDYPSTVETVQPSRTAKKKDQGGNEANNKRHQKERKKKKRKKRGFVRILPLQNKNAE